MIPTMLLNMANWMSLIMLDQVLNPQSEIGTFVNYILPNLAKWSMRLLAGQSCRACVQCLDSNS